MLLSNPQSCKVFFITMDFLLLLLLRGERGTLESYKRQEKKTSLSAAASTLFQIKRTFLHRAQRAVCAESARVAFFISLALATFHNFFFFFFQREYNMAIVETLPVV